MYNCSFMYYSFTLGVEDIFPPCGSVQVILLKSLFLLPYINLINAHCLNIASRTSEAYRIIMWGNCNNYDNIKSLHTHYHTLQGWNANSWLYYGIHHQEKPGRYTQWDSTTIVNNVGRLQF